MTDKNMVSYVYLINGLRCEWMMAYKECYINRDNKAVPECKEDNEYIPLKSSWVIISWDIPIYKVINV